MNVMPTMKDAAAMTEPRARVGLIIPSVNTYSEPQFNHFAPDGLGIRVPVDAAVLLDVFLQPVLVEAFGVVQVPAVIPDSDEGDAELAE